MLVYGSELTSRHLVSLASTRENLLHLGGSCSAPHSSIFPPHNCCSMSEFTSECPRHIADGSSLLDPLHRSHLNSLVNIPLNSPRLNSALNGF